MQAIAEFLGIKRSVAYHLAANQRIPTFKIGRTVCARRSKILAALEALVAIIMRTLKASGH